MPTFANDSMQAISRGIVHDNVSTVSAIILDFDGPGVGHAYFCKLFPITSSMTM
jgi:hypothetical protein